MAATGWTHFLAQWVAFKKNWTKWKDGLPKKMAAKS
jgi:hypothetical protein